jgi:hypothetical protein
LQIYCERSWINCGGDLVYMTIWAVTQLRSWTILLRSWTILYRLGFWSSQIGKKGICCIYVSKEASSDMCWVNMLKRPRNYFSQDDWPCQNCVIHVSLSTSRRDVPLQYSKVRLLAVETEMSLFSFNSTHSILMK